MPARRSWSLLVLGCDAGARRDGEALPAEATGAGTRIELGVTTGDGLTVQVEDLRRFGWDRTVEQVRAVLDRARIEYNTKRAAFELVQAAEGAAQAAAGLRGLELDREVEGAVLELLLARW